MSMEINITSVDLGVGVDIPVVTTPIWKRGSFALLRSAAKDAGVLLSPNQKGAVLMSRVKHGSNRAEYMARPSPKIMVRFFDKIFVSPNGCWIWTGSLDTNGYGKFKLNGKSRSVHRISYAFFNREIPEGMTVNHTCCKRCCVNPDHLELMTMSENGRDSWERNHSWTPAYRRGPDEPNDIPF